MCSQKRRQNTTTDEIDCFTMMEKALELASMNDKDSDDSRSSHNEEKFHLTVQHAMNEKIKLSRTIPMN